MMHLDLFRSQAHVPPHAPPSVDPPAPAPARTQESAQRGPKTQKETEEEKDLPAPLRCDAHHPGGRRGGSGRRRSGGSHHVHRATSPSTGTTSVSAGELGPPLSPTPPLPLSLVWGAKKTWRNPLRSHPSTQKMKIILCHRKPPSLRQRGQLTMGGWLFSERKTRWMKRSWAAQGRLQRLSGPGLLGSAGLCRQPYVRAPSGFWIRSEMFQRGFLLP